MERWPRGKTVGAEGRNRTADTTIFSRVLYRLSYLGTMDEPTGLRQLRTSVGIGPGSRYNSAMRSSSLPERILLVGYFDRGNLGDDLMRDALHEALPRLLSEGAHIETARFPALRPSSMREVVRLIGRLWRSNVVLLAGGSHFHDRFGWRSLRILSSVLGLMVFARVSGAKVGYAGIGIGPLRGVAGRALVRLLLRLAHAIHVRDEHSARLCRRLVPSRPTIEGVDLAFLIPPEGRAREPRRDGPFTLGLSVIPYFSEFERDEASDTRAIDAIAEAIAAVAREIPLRVALLPFFDARESRRSDYVISERLVSLLRTCGVTAETRGGSVEQAKRTIAACDAVLATRYHAALLAYVEEKPMVIVEYDPKCRALADQLGLPSTARVLPAELLDSAFLTGRIRALIARHEDFRPAVRVAAMHEHAQVALREFVDAVVGERVKAAP